MICMISVMLPRAAVSASRIDEVLTSETMIHDPKQPLRIPEEGKGKVVFDHVSFRYPGAEEDVLHDISFTAEPGKTTAFIGSTGCGKSTLVNLIPRFYDVTDGKITIDGKDVRDVSQHELREKLGYVPQKAVLFSGDIASNILYGNPDGSEAEMIEAATIAQATEFIDQKKKNIRARSHREEPMYPVVRSRDFRLQEQLQNIRMYIYSMIVFRHWIIRQMQHSVQS